MAKNILTIGAYERDNFGDILFFLVLEYISKKYNTHLVLGSYIESDMKEYFGREILQYDYLLSEYLFDAIWVVGGQIGACTIPIALEMSLAKNSEKIDTSILDSKIDYITQPVFFHTANDHLAYLPQIEKYDKNQQTPIVINSVGGFEDLEKCGNSVVVKNTLSTLQRATVISVRSRESSKYLLSRGIQNILAPDSVHALSLFYQPQNPLKGDYILFQINEELFNVYGIEIIAKSLNELMEKYHYPIYLFFAGTAPGHDNLNVYKNLKKYIEEVYKNNQIFIIFEKNSLKRVDWIAYAKVWIGSSLHGRIIATAYKVPRVGLVIEKLSQYAETWDHLFPYNIHPSTLIDAYERALLIDVAQIELLAFSLSKLAKDNIESIFERLYQK